MVKHGYTDDNYNILPLVTLKILWSCDPNIVGSRLTMNTEIFVDRAICNLQELSPPKWRKEVALSQSRIIKTYLDVDVQDGDNAESNLHRVFNNDPIVCWKCEAHAHQLLSSQSLTYLKEFVHDHGGHVDMQQSKNQSRIGING